MRLRRRQGIPNSREESPCPRSRAKSFSSRSPGVPESRNSRSHLVHLAQRPVASGSGLRSLGDSGVQKAFWRPQSPGRPRSLASLAQGSRASGFRLQASASGLKLQTPDFKFQLSTSEFKLQTSNFKLQVSTLEFKVQTSSFNFGVQTPDFKFQLWSSGSRPQVSALGFWLA